MLRIPKVVRPWLIGAAVLLSIQLIEGTYSYFRTDIKNEDMLTVGTLQITILQGMDTLDSTSKDTLLGDELVPGSSIDKTAYVKNHGNRPAYIRVRVNKSWQGIRLHRGNNDWIEEQQADGGFMLYYRYPVEPQENTSFFVEQLSLDSLEMDNQFADKSANVTYHAEAVQKNIGVEAIASAWNKKATINQSGEIIKLEEQ